MSSSAMKGFKPITPVNNEIKIITQLNFLLTFLGFNFDFGKAKVFNIEFFYLC